MGNFSLFCKKKQGAPNYFDHFFKFFGQIIHVMCHNVIILQHWPSLFTFRQFRSMKLRNCTIYRVSKSIFGSIVNVKNRPGSYRKKIILNFSLRTAVPHCLFMLVNMLEKLKNITGCCALLCVN